MDAQSSTSGEDPPILRLPDLSLPGFLCGSPLGDRLTGRMAHNDFQAISRSDLPPEWRHDDADRAQLLEYQRQMKIKTRPTPNHRQCDYCGSIQSVPPDVADQTNAAESPAVRPYRKCSRCRIVYYCSHRCQRRGWSAHKQVCQPPEPQVEACVGILLPDLVCFHAYQRFHDPRCEDPAPTCIVSTEQYVERFGEAQLRKTILTLAAHGRPDVGSVAGFVRHATRIFCAHERASDRQAGPDIDDERRSTASSANAGISTDFVEHVPTVALAEHLLPGARHVSELDAILGDLQWNFPGP